MRCAAPRAHASPRPRRAHKETLVMVLRRIIPIPTARRGGQRSAGRTQRNRHAMPAPRRTPLQFSQAQNARHPWLPMRQGTSWTSAGHEAIREKIFGQLPKAHARGLSSDHIHGKILLLPASAVSPMKRKPDSSSDEKPLGGKIGDVHPQIGVVRLNVTYVLPLINAPVNRGRRQKLDSKGPPCRHPPALVVEPPDDVR